MKKYTKDMTAEEVIRRLWAGEIVRCNESGTGYRISNGLLCRFFDDGEYNIGVQLNPQGEGYYFDCPDEFEITKTGLYRTRDGRKVFVSKIDDDGDQNYPIVGLIEGASSLDSWDTSGLWDGIAVKTTNRDIVGEWK